MFISYTFRKYQKNNKNITCNETHRVCQLVSNKICMPICARCLCTILTSMLLFDGIFGHQHRTMHIDFFVIIIDDQRRKVCNNNQWVHNVMVKMQLFLSHTSYSYSNQSKSSLTFILLEFVFTERSFMLNISLNFINKKITQTDVK